MSVDVSPGIESIGAQLAENDEIDATTAALLGIIRGQGKIIERQSEELDDLSGRVDDLEASDEQQNARLDDLEAKTDENETQTKINKSRLNGVCDSIDRIEEQSSTADPEGMDAEEGEVAASQISQTPLERITAMPEEICDYTNDQRARHIAMDIFQYGDRCTNGRYLAPEDIRTILHSREKTPAASHDNTVTRVRERLDELGGDDVTIIDRGHKQLIEFSDEIVSRLKNLAKLREKCPALVCDESMAVRG